MKELWHALKLHTVTLLVYSTMVHAMEWDGAITSFVVRRSCGHEPHWGDSIFRPSGACDDWTFIIDGRSPVA
ncbi:hypothetical protein BS17DRAFT_788408 [Gyrodon lividus]|nr:hypothetical protein BS17DRAFT_788408 [Gyrodon lividus]